MSDDKEPLTFPKGDTKGTSVRIPMPLFEEFRSSHMFNPFSPFTDFSAFLIDGLARNLELWKRRDFSDRYKRVLAVMELEAKQRDEANLQKLADECFNLIRAGNFEEAEKYTSLLAPSDRDLLLLRIKVARGTDAV